MKRIPLMIGLTFLLVLAACSGNSEDSSNAANSEKSSNEQMNSADMNEAEAGDAMESEEAAGSQEDKDAMSESDLTIMISEESSDDHGEHSEGHGAEIRISLQNDEMEPTTLMAEIQKGDQLLTEGDVRFEYWKEGEEKHIYTDAEEKGEGMYEGMAEISEPGTYSLKVHVEKGEELHTHKPYVLEVTEK